MASGKHAISEHDVVVLREREGSWPAGTTGTVISDYGDTKLVEVTGPAGKTIDTIQIAATRLDAKRT